MTTVFGKIIAGQLPCQKVFENERILAIKDLYPVAPVHILIMPKKEIANLGERGDGRLDEVTARTRIIEYLVELAKQGALLRPKRYIQDHKNTFE